MNPFLYYTKGQRKAVYTLIILLALTFLFKIRYRILPSDNNEIPAVASAESERDSFNIKYQAFYTGFVENERRSKSRFSSAPKPPELFPFDPNKCDSATFVRLGFSRYVIGNMIKYRNKGGRFRSPESLSRIYGMDSLHFLAVAPYINIDSSLWVSKSNLRDSVGKTVRMAVNEKFEDVVQIELNAADTTLLMKIPGIGPVFAKAIIDYRDRLGGYYSSGQIREISFIPDSVIEKIQPWFIIDTLLINHLKINELSVAAMKRHPYLNYYQARVFYDIRRERGTVRDFEDIVFMEEFSDADIDRIKHYVKF